MLLLYLGFCTQNHFKVAYIAVFCKSFVRSVRSFPLHKFRIIKRRFIQELEDHSVAALKNLKKHKQVCLYLLENSRKTEFVVLKLAHGHVSKFLLAGSNRMLVV